jgi:hypothetical protein
MTVIVESGKVAFNGGGDYQRNQQLQEVFLRKARKNHSTLPFYNNILMII